MMFMKKPLSKVYLFLLCGVLMVLPVAQSLRAEATELPVVRIAGAINPVQAQFVIGELSRANSLKAPAFLIELDTPGGLDTAMRDIIQGILSSEIAVIVYVSPSGARAASAGALITLAADFAAMAPGTNIGAATPIAISGDEQGETLKKKIVNDAVAYARSLAEQRGRDRDWAEKIVSEGISTPAQEALERQVIDLVVESREELLAQLDGKRYLRRGEARHLALAGAVPVVAEMNWRQRVLDTISNPTLAYLLMMLGLLGIFFEISQPGVILPGVVGAIAILLALFAFQTLPINYAGVLLILLAMVLFILEIKVASYGMLTVGGIISLALGSLMLIDSSEPYMQVSRVVIFATVTVCSGFFVFCLYYVMRTQKTRFQSGSEGMVGEEGRAVTAVHDGGQVFVHGEYWDAFAAEPIAAGATIVIVRIVNGMRLEVRALNRQKDSVRLD